jgi:nucleoside-diphosphate-sugar epimerase
MEFHDVSVTALRHAQHPETTPAADLSGLGRVLVTGGSGFIGSHLLALLDANGVPCLNIDIAPVPIATSHARFTRIDIHDAAALETAFREFAPEVVIHLAARTDLSGTELAEYSANTDGTRAVVTAVNATPSVRRFIGTSTQYVVAPGKVPAHDEDFAAYSPYGESKVLTEQIIRSDMSTTDWVIIRPTNIWGPRHPFLPERIWRYIKRGLYIHPGRAPIYRAYAYVDSVTTQILQLAMADRAAVAGQVFYVGEEPVEFLGWANAFAQRLTGRDVRVVPRRIWRGLAMVGDVMPRFPMNSARFERMTTDDRPQIAKTLALCGPPPTPFDEAVDRTVAWLETHWAAETKP